MHSRWLTLTLLLFACQSGSAEWVESDQCEQVIGRLIALETAAPDGADEETVASLAAHAVVLAESVDPQAVADCGTRSPAWRRCVLAATDLDGVHTCAEAR